MQILFKLPIIFFFISTLAQGANENMSHISWKIEDDVSFYKNLNLHFPLELQAVVFDKQRPMERDILNDIDRRAARAEKWILLLKINRNSAIFTAHFIDLLNANETVNYFKAEYLGAGKMNKHFKTLQNTPKNELMHLIFNQACDSFVDYPNRKILDGTMYYVTASSGNKICRAAIYEPFLKDDSSSSDIKKSTDINGENNISKIIELIEAIK